MQEYEDTDIYFWDRLSYMKDFYPNKNYIALNTAETKQLAEAYEEAKEKQLQRLDFYLKKYGLTKIKTHTYLVD